MKYLLSLLLRWFPPYCAECGTKLQYGFYDGDLCIDVCPACHDDTYLAGYEDGRGSK